MTDQTTPQPGGARPSAASRILIGLAVAAWLGVLVWVFRWSSDPSASDASRRGAVSDPARYVGNRVCAECHPGEYARHAGSGHARTLAPAPRSRAARRVDGQSVPDPEDPDVQWTFALRGERLEFDRTRGAEVNRQVVEYAFGSGYHAVTFVSLTGETAAGPTALEHRISLFGHGAPGLTPGQSRGANAPGTTPVGRNFTADETRKCFECHCTLSSDRGAGVLDPRTMVPNIGCERCHGPGQAHAAAARRGDRELAMPFGPGRWTAAEQMRLCGQCHRLPEFVPPDQRYPENAVLRRFQSVGLMLSRCYTESRGRLSCTTCHEPHARVATGAAAYNAACVQCHQTAPQAVCRVSDSGCIDCHMPKRESGANLFFADHWIRRNRD